MANRLIFALLMLTASTGSTEVKEAIDLVFHPEKNEDIYIVNVGDVLMISCTAVNDLNKSPVIWTGPSNKKISESSGRVHMENHAHSVDLFFEHVNVEDNGFYFCSAEGDGSSVSKALRLRVVASTGSTEVKEAIDLVFHPEKNEDIYIVNVGDVLMISCTAKNDLNKSPLIWTGPANKKISESSGRVHMENHAHSVDLFFEHVNVEDNGFYICSAEGDGSSVSKALRLRVVASTGSTEVKEAIDLVFHPEKNEDIYIVNVGDVLMISCTAKNDLNKSPLSWTGPANKKISESSGRVHMENLAHSVDLFFEHVNLEDNGFYFCSAEGDGSSVSKALRLRVDVSVTFFNVEEHPTFQEGEDGFISCEVAAQIPPLIRWKFQGNYIENGAKYDVSPKGLTIHNVASCDKGEYECVAAITEISVVKAKHIKVEVKPIIRLQPDYTAYYLSASDEVKLEVTCIPPDDTTITDLVWSDSFNRKITEDNNTSIYVQRIGTSHTKLIITKLDFVENQYRCSAVMNGIRRYSQPVKVYLFEYVETYNVSERNQIFYQGENRILRCSAKGNPKPVIQWTFNSHLVTENEKYSILHDGLLIRDVQSSDAGMYNCHTEQTTPIYDNVKMELYRVQVIPKSKFEKPADVVELETRDVVLACPNYSPSDVEGCHWYHGSLFVENTIKSGTKLFGRYKIEQDESSCHLTIETVGPEDQGIWTCVHNHQKDRVNLWVADIRASYKRGSRLPLYCTVPKGSTDPCIWISPSGELHSNQTNPTSDILLLIGDQNCDLVIEKLEPEHVGMWKCFFPNHRHSETKIVRILEAERRPNKKEEEKRDGTQPKIQT